MREILINPQLVAKVIHSLGMYVADLEYHSNHRDINDINQDNNSRQWDSIDELKGFIRELKDDINELKDEVNCHDIASDQSSDMEMSGASCCALNEIDQVMSNWFPETEWNVEWRSVLGEDHLENPIWSLTFYVETQDSRKKLEEEDD